MYQLTKNDLVRELLFGGAKNGGKSFLGVSWIFSSAMMFPGTSYFIARKELGDLTKYTIPSIYEFFDVIGLKLHQYCDHNKTASVFNLHNGSKVYLLACRYQPSDPLYERFGSMQMTQGWIEEGGEVHELAYENLKLSIGRWKNDTYKLKAKLLITCNPKKNWMYRVFYKPFTLGTLDPKLYFIKSLITDNIFRQSGSIEQLDGIKNKVAKARLRYGEWEYNDDETSLMSYDAISDIFLNEHVPEGTMYITADIARFGKDMTVIRVWSGWRAVKRIQMEQKSVVEVADKIRAVATAEGIPMSRVLVDEDGLGGGVVDILSCKGFIANSSQIKVKGLTLNYNNLKSQCAFHLAGMVNNAEVYDTSKEHEERIKEELSQVKNNKVDSDTKQQIISKDIMKSFLGRSPDDLDCYIMRSYFDLRNTETGEATKANNFKSGFSRPTRGRLLS